MQAREHSCTKNPGWNFLLCHRLPLSHTSVYGLQTNSLGMNWEVVKNTRPCLCVLQYRTRVICSWSLQSTALGPAVWRYHLWCFQNIPRQTAFPGRERHATVVYKENFQNDSRCSLNLELRLTLWVASVFPSYWLSLPLKDKWRPQLWWGDACSAFWPRSAWQRADVQLLL